MGQVVDYVVRLDLPLAAVVAGSAIAIAFAINWFLQATSDELARALPGLGRWLGHSAVDLAHAEVDEPWFCPECHSLNDAGSEVCYHGCVVRVRVADLGDEFDDGDPGDGPARVA